MEASGLTLRITPALNQVYFPVNHGSMAGGYGMFGQELRYDAVRPVNQIVLSRRSSEPGRFVPVNHGSMAGGYGMFGQELRYDAVRPVNQIVLSHRSSEPGRFVPPNVSFSTPRPVTGTVRSELPSLQYPETDSSRQTSPPPPPYHAIPSYIQPTPMALSTQSDSASQSSSLLEAIVQESHTGSTVREQSSENSSNYSSMSPIYTPEYSLPDFSCIIGERSDDLYPPFLQPEVSRFMEYESNDGISLDDLLDFDGTLGLEKIEPSAGQTSTPDVDEKDVSDAGDSQKPQ